MTAGVKMSDITFEVDDTAKTVTPILPKPTIGDVVVDSGSLDFFENNPSVEIDEVIEALQAGCATGNQDKRRHYFYCCQQS